MRVAWTFLRLAIGSLCSEQARRQGKILLADSRKILRAIDERTHRANQAEARVFDAVGELEHCISQLVAMHASWDKCAATATIPPGRTEEWQQAWKVCSTYRKKDVIVLIETIEAAIKKIGALSP
jgi:hypothetical protein